MANKILIVHSNYVQQIKFITIHQNTKLYYFSSIVVSRLSIMDSARKLV